VNDLMGVDSISKALANVGKCLSNINTCDFKTHKQVFEFVKTVPKVCPPEWIELNNNVDRVVAEKLTENTIEK